MSIPRRCTGGRSGAAPGAAQVRAAFSREARVLQNNKKLIRLFISRSALAAPLPLAACLDYLAAKKQDGGDAHRRHALGLELFAAGAPLRAGAAAQSPSQPSRSSHQRPLNHPMLRPLGPAARGLRAPRAGLLYGRADAVLAQPHAERAVDQVLRFLSSEQGMAILGVAGTAAGAPGGRSAASACVASAAGTLSECYPCVLHANMAE